MKKILLTSAKLDYARFISLGIAYIAAYLERVGYEVRIYDEVPNSLRTLTDVLKEFQPDVIGISCLTATFSRACEYAKEVKAYMPSLPVVFGGVHPTVTVEETLAHDFVDFVIYGEGEETFLEFLSKYEKPGGYSDIPGLAFKDDGQTRVNPPRPLISDFESLPMPARHLFPMEYYTQRWNWPRGNWFRTANLMSSRGCPYECTFCGSKSMFGRSFRASSPQKTVDEAEHLIKRYGFECLSFSDDTFAVNKKRALDICREIKRRNLKAAYRFQLRADTSDEDLVRELKSIGCVHIDIGAESGSDKILKRMKKGITVKQIEESVATIKRNKIRAGVTFIIGSPEETMDDIEETKNLALRLKADYTQFFVMTSYPGTELFQFAKEHGLLPEFLTYDHFRHGGQNLKPFLNTDIPPEKLIQLREDLNKMFADAIAMGYLRQPNFLFDVAGMCLRDPKLIGSFLKEYLRTKNLGSALKQILPHKL